MEYTKLSYGCGCSIKHDDGKDRIEYCPLHKSALDLYEALGLYRFIVGKTGYHIERDVAEKLWNESGKILAKADGK